MPSPKRRTTVKQINVDKYVKALLILMKYPVEQRLKVFRKLWDDDPFHFTRIKDDIEQILMEDVGK